MILTRASRRRLAACARSLVLLGSVLGLIVSSAVPSFAAGGQTGNVIGTIVDATTGAPLAGAAVTLTAPTGTSKTTTDGKGFFSILGLNVDTYTISVEAKGYESFAREGVTIIGDQNLSLGTIKIAKRSLKQIGSVSVRSVSSAFQPNQTVDSVTVSGQRIAQATGKNDSTDEKALVQAIPGVTIDSSNNIIIRGSLSTEVGYQLDGVPYTEPFFSRNASAGTFNGLGSLQVVEGAGDATQGNSGGGTVNIVPQRGTYPGTGLFDTEIGGPNFDHQLAISYGFATPNGRISNYFSYTGSRFVPYYGYANSNAASLGAYYGISNESNDDILDNFVFKFGKDNNQSLQVLYQNRDLQEYGDRGGIAGQLFYPNDPQSYEAQSSYAYLTSALGATAGLAAYQKLIGLNPFTPTAGTQANGIISPEQVANNPTSFLKFEYTGSFGDNFLDVKAYNTFQFANAYAETSEYGGNTDPSANVQGGQRTGLKADFTHQFGSKNTTTLDFSYENQHPIWNGFFSPVDSINEALNLPGLNGTEPLLADFVSPVNGVCPIANGCALAQYFPNGIPRLPIPGINYHGSDFLNYGAAIRDQYSPTDKLKIDAGLRLDTEDYKIAPNPVNAGLPIYLSDPSDVTLSSIGDTYSKPSVLEPRLALSYRVDNDDSIRASYGRSVVFLNAQTFGTPASLYNYAPFTSIPATDTVANPLCGSFVNNAPGPYKCLNLAQEIFWAYDQNNDAPDLGNAKYEADTNYDFTYQHQFKNGIGMRITPFYKESTGVPDFAVLSSTVNPITGQIEGFVFTVNNNGVNKATGLEFGLTLPDRPVGLSGFLSATYQNVFDRVTPLTSGEDGLPFIYDNSVNLGDTYRAGYLSPFTAKLGLDYKTKFGLEVRPIVNFNRGYPFSAGNTVASNGFCPIAANVPAANFGCGTTFYPGFEGITSGFALTGQNSPNYVDPAYPGNSTNPNIAATRGTPATASSGGVLSKPEAEADLDIELHVGKDNRQTLGLLVQNLTGNVYYGSVPIINPYYQPVSTGVAGPQTGQNALANPAYAGGLYSKTAANVPLAAYGNGPYLLLPNMPITYTLYYQLKL